MKKNIGNITFLEAFSKTGKILNITISSPSIYEMPKLLNYITAPNVLIWSAVVASCSVPKFFKSSTLYCKNFNGEILPWYTCVEEERWIDGSVENDIPSEILKSIFNAKIFIVSQVNPHIYPFVILKKKSGFFGRLLNSITFLLMSEFEFRLNQFSRLKLMPTLVYFIRSILFQRYTGEFTILHQLTWYDYWTMFSSSKDDVLSVVKKGEYSTKNFIQKISRISSIEKTLNYIIEDLKKELDCK